MQTALVFAAALFSAAVLSTSAIGVMAKFKSPPFDEYPNALLSAEGFDPHRPGVMVVYFHGHGGTLGDMIDRQFIPQQVADANVNAVLVAPRLRKRATGRFSEQDFFTAFLDEAAERLATITGGRASADVFRRMPVVIVFYSGGYLPARALLQNGGGAVDRILGIASFDGMYGDPSVFAQWIAEQKNKETPGFFVSIYAQTPAGNAKLKHVLDGARMPYRERLGEHIRAGDTAIVDLGAQVSHRDMMSKAWTDGPLGDLLRRM